MVMPSALEVLRLKARRGSCTVGRLSHEVGWKYQDVVSTLKARRKVKSTRFYKKKRSTEQLKEKARQCCQED